MGYNYLSMSNKPASGTKISNSFRQPALSTLHSNMNCCLNSYWDQVSSFSTYQTWVHHPMWYAGNGVILELINYMVLFSSQLCMGTLALWLIECPYSLVYACLSSWCEVCVNTLRPRQNGRHFADDTLKRIFLKENVRISIKISLNFVPKIPIDNISALFQIMAWRRPGDKPLSEAMMVSLLTHICVARPHWVNRLRPGQI